ncbi:hypothetical protein [Cellulomonas sp. B6]|uniref:hypothetical protein n=1 Tax=Cellulomonas sp. B6 TaxID=1295626 RepID=UPI001CC0CCC9|nr:hypothetical protein [Cellulomonas sp. B6]
MPAREENREWGHREGGLVLLAACAVMAALAWLARRTLHVGDDDEDDTAGVGLVEHLVAAVPPLG